MKKSDLIIGGEYAVKLRGYDTLNEANMGREAARIGRCVLVDSSNPTDETRWHKGERVIVKNVKLELVEDYKEPRWDDRDHVRPAGSVIYVKDARSIICEWPQFIAVREAYLKEKAEREAVDQDIRERHSDVTAALLTRGIVIFEPERHTRRPNLVTMPLEEAEKLVAALEKT